MQNSYGSKVQTLHRLYDGQVEALEFIVNSDSKLLGIPLKDLSLRKNTLIAGIVRDRKIIIPSGDDYLVAGDKVVITSNRRINKLLQRND